MLSTARRYTTVLFTLLRPTSCWREMQFSIISLRTIRIDSTHNERRSFFLQFGLIGGSENTDLQSPVEHGRNRGSKFGGSRHRERRRRR